VRGLLYTIIGLSVTVVFQGPVCKGQAKEEDKGWME